MRHDYEIMQDQILPGRDKQDEIWNIIEQKAKKGLGKFSHWHAIKLTGGIAAAALVCTFCFPQTGFADNVKGFLNQFFASAANVNQDIVKNVYEDSDGHVKMQVTEMLSDGACAYLDICYQALDDEGKRWLSNKKMETDSIQFLYEGDVVGNTNGWTAGLEEYEDIATEESRYFTFYYKDFSGNFNMNGIERILSYPMCGKEGKGKIKVSSNMDTFAYRLQGEGSPSKFYKPEYLLVSKLSYGIFGKNQGVYTRISAKGYSGEYINKEFDSSPDSDGPDVSFIMKDGSKIKQVDIAGMSPALNVPGYDLTVKVGYFHDGEDDYWGKHTTINSEELVGVEISGVYYDLVQ